MNWLWKFGKAGWRRGKNILGTHKDPVEIFSYGQQGIRWRFWGHRNDMISILLLLFQGEVVPLGKGLAGREWHGGLVVAEFCPL